jgi:antitoxin (DNA-binding transcriptional repressor) of toxin-antitoxin stability system
MNALTVNATDFARGLSEYLNQVQYTGQVLDIERAKRVIARVSPVPAASSNIGFPISQLPDLFAKGVLPATDRKRMANDVRAVRHGLRAKADPWAS